MEAAERLGAPIPICSVAIISHKAYIVFHGTREPLLTSAIPSKMLIVQANVADPSPWSLVGRARTVIMEIDHQDGRSDGPDLGAVPSWVGDAPEGCPGHGRRYRRPLQRRGPRNRLGRACRQFGIQYLIVVRIYDPRVAGQAELGLEHLSQSSGG